MSNLKSQMSNGFTLVEILVVMAILSIVGVIVLVIFSSTLKGSNKSQILLSIKQNGQAVLENMDKNLRNADNLVCPNPGNTTAVVKNGIYVRYRIDTPAQARAGNAPLICLDNGCILTDNPTPEPSEITPPAFINRICNPSNPMSSATILTDTNPQSGVKIVSGSFTPSKAAGFKDVVSVTFVLTAGVQAPASLAGQIDPVTFETSVQLR